MTLTDAGIAFMPHAQRALTAVQEGRDAIEAVEQNNLNAGGGNIGLRLAFALEKDYTVRVIEHNKRRCEALGARLGQALVLNGDATDEERLLHLARRILRALELALLTGHPLSWWHRHAPPEAPAPSRC